jgi:hypothetical protein
VTDDLPLVLLIGPDSPIVVAVAAVLQDWSAVGLVRDHAWLTDSDVEARGVVAPATVVASGLRRAVPLRDHVADQRDLSALRLCAVSVVGPDGRAVGAGSANTLLEHLDRQLSAVTPVHCLLARYGGPGWDPDVVMPRWTNVLLAPADGWDPTSVPAPFDAGSDEARFVAHAAAGLAGVAGLWSGMAEAPLDTEEVKGNVVTVVRSYLRRLEATEVSESLRVRLSDLSHAVPRSRTARGPLPQFGLPEQACEEMAEQVFARHANLFERPRPRRPEKPRPRWVSARLALRMFAAFLWAALRDAPRVWLNGVLAAMARLIQGGLFGQDSQYEVIVRGITPFGMRALPEDFIVAAERISASAGEPLERRVQGVDRFWQDVVEGAFTLGDGQRRSVAPVFVDDEPGVVDRVDRIAPDPDGRFELPPQLAAHVERPGLAPWDVIGVIMLRKELRALADKGGGPAADAGRALDDMAAWWVPRIGSYVVQVGTRLVTEFDRAVQELAELLQAAHDTESSAGLGQGLHATSRSVRRIQLALALALVAITILSVVGILAPLTAVTAAVSAVALSAMVSFGVFYRGQLSLFRYVNAAEEAAVRHAPDRVAALARVVRTTATLLVQYGCWAPLLGRFVHEPYGVKAARSSSPVRLAGALPRAMGLAVVHPVERDLAVMSAELRRELFEPGWLGNQWDELLASVPGRLGADGVELRDNITALYGDLGGDPSLLRRLSDDVVRHGVGKHADATLWGKARGRLLSDGWPTLAAKLFSSIEVATWPARPGRDDAVGFLQKLLDTDRRGRFDATLFTSAIGDFEPNNVVRTIVTAFDDLHEPVSATPGAASVRRVAPESGGQDGLDRFVLITQLAAARPANLIDLSGGAGSMTAEPDQGDRPQSDVLA